MTKKPKEDEMDTKAKYFLAGCGVLLIGSPLIATFIAGTLWLTCVFFTIIACGIVYSILVGHQIISVKLNNYKARTQASTRDYIRSGNFSIIDAGRNTYLTDDSGNLMNVNLQSDTYANITGANEHDIDGSRKWVLRNQITPVQSECNVSHHGDTTLTRVNPMISRLTPRRNSITQFKPNLLTRMDGAVIIQGVSGTGKTTLMKQLVKKLLDAEKHVCVCDPHAYDGSYPNGVHVIGQGRNYLEIEKVLKSSLDICDERYNDSAFRGDPKNFDNISIVIDEFTGLADRMPETLAMFMKTACADFRKINLHAYLFTHVDDVRTMGVKNMNSMLEYFDRVRLFGDPDFKAEFRKGGTKNWIEFSRGDYNHVDNEAPVITGYNRLQSPVTSVDNRPNPYEKAIENSELIREIYDRTGSINQVIKELYGGCKNKDRLEAVKAVLKNYT